jgi:hypothetical protein
MGRSIRKTYPVKLNYIVRLNAGRLQKSTGIPASLVHRIRRGEVKSFSPSTIAKLSKVYDEYWKAREVKHGARPDEAASWVKADRPPEYFRKKEDALLNAARKVQEARINRDRLSPGFNSTWHTLTDILDQMARDTSRTADDWTLYVRKVITGTLRQAQGPNAPRPVRYTSARIAQWKADNAKHKRRRRQEVRREADRRKPA